MDKKEQKKQLVAVLAGFLESLEKDRKTRAQLRRCSAFTQAAVQRGFHQLFFKIREVDGDLPEKERLSEGAIMGLSLILAQLKAHVPAQSTASLFAAPKPEGSKPQVSEQRFQRVLKQESREALVFSLLRTLALVKYQANLGDLLDLLRYWGEGPGLWAGREQQRKTWAREYYAGFLDHKYSR